MNTMSNLRTLGIRKQPINRRDSSGAIRQDILNRWVVMTDPETDREYPPHYSVSDFSDEFYRDFFAHNNNIIDAASRLGLLETGLGEGYDRFFEQGLRVSQKYDTQYGIRNRFKAEYEKLLNNLREQLINTAIEQKRSRRDSNLDAIVEASSNVPEEDRATIENIVEQLKQKPIEERKPGYLAREPNLNERISELLRDEYAPLVELYPIVDDSIKAKFLDVATYAELHGKRIPAIQFIEDFYPIVKELGPRNAVIYLGFLRDMVEREDTNFYDEGIRYFMGYITDLDGESRNFFFDILGRAVKAGMSHNAPLFAYEAALLTKKESKEKAEQVIETGFKIFDETKHSGKAHGYLMMDYKTDNSSN